MLTEITVVSGGWAVGPGDEADGTWVTESCSLSAAKKPCWHSVHTFDPGLFSLPGGQYSSHNTNSLHEHSRLGLYITPFNVNIAKIYSQGFQVRSRAGRWSWTLSPEEIMSKELELRKLDFFRFRLFLNSGATDIVFVTLPKHGSWNNNCAVHKSLGNGEGTPP